MDAEPSQVERAFIAEVHALHDYLEDWLKGDVAEAERGPVRLKAALAEGFHVIHPDGRREDRAAVIRNFALAYGNKSRDYRLNISNVFVRVLDNRLCIATYQESHHGGGGRSRTSTAVLRQRPDGRAIEWLFLQETFLAEARVARPATVSVG